ncbi:hypothetical protein GCM10010455_14640 [Microbacterium esteraromaticum]
MPDCVERQPRQAVCDQLRLTLTARREGSVIDAVLGILMFTVSDQIYVVRHCSLASARRVRGASPA